MISTVKMERCEPEKAIFLQSTFRREISSWGLTLDNVSDNKTMPKSCPKITKPPNHYAVSLKHLPVWFTDSRRNPSASAPQLRTHPHDNPEPSTQPAATPKPAPKQKCTNTQERVLSHCCGAHTGVCHPGLENQNGNGIRCMPTTLTLR